MRHGARRGPQRGRLLDCRLHPAVQSGNLGGQMGNGQPNTANRCNLCLFAAVFNRRIFSRRRGVRLGPVDGRGRRALGAARRIRRRPLMEHRVGWRDLHLDNFHARALLLPGVGGDQYAAAFDPTPPLSPRRALPHANAATTHASEKSAKTIIAATTPPRKAAATTAWSVRQIVRITARPLQCTAR